MFQPLENNRPFAKIALEGFAGDGKTYTAVSLAIGIHKLIGSKKPIALFDTERALKALKHRFDEAEIKAVSDESSRSLASLSQAMKWCEDGGADVLVIDSITHVWENFLEAYKAEKRRTQLQFQDWGVIKPKWKKDFSDVFVRSNVHIIFTGRAGYEYTEEKDENGKREIHKSGIKMKAETETAFEPDLLVLMERHADVISEKKNIFRTATILKDRTTKIDGKTFKNPTFEDFFPAIKILLDGEIKSVHGQEIPDTFQDFEERFSAIGRKKDMLIAEIEGSFKLIGLGTGAKDQQVKAWILNKTFQVKSLEAVRTIGIDTIQDGESIISRFSIEYAKYLQECAEAGLQPDAQKVKEIYESVERG